MYGLSNQTNKRSPDSPFSVIKMTYCIKQYKQTSTFLLVLQFVKGLFDLWSSSGFTTRAAAAFDVPSTFKPSTTQISISIRPVKIGQIDETMNVPQCLLNP